MLPFPASNALPHITYEADRNARTVKKNAIYYEKQNKQTKQNKRTLFIMKNKTNKNKNKTNYKNKTKNCEFPY